MKSLLNHLYPWWLWWIEGWRDLMSIWTNADSLLVCACSGDAQMVWKQGQWIPSERPSNAVLLDPKIVLLRQLDLPILTPAQIATAVEGEVIRSSPFHRQATRSGYRTTITGNARCKVEVAIIHEREVQSLSERPVYAKGITGPIPLAIRPSKAARQITRMLLALCAVLLFIYVAIPMAYYRQKTIIHISAFEKLQRGTAAQQQHRESIQTELTQHQVIGEFAANHANALQVLEKLSAAIPDNSFLLYLNLQERTLKLEGQTPNALSLVNQLQSIPEFSGAQISGAVQRHPQTGKDIFQVQMNYTK